jgi:anti-sigma factor RsiW
MSDGCERYSDALIERAAGRPAPDRDGRLEAHLAECHECRERLRVTRLVATTGPVPPPGLENRIRDAVRAAGAHAQAAPAPGPNGRGGWSRGWRWAVPPLAAAAVAAVIWLAGGEDPAVPGADVAEPEVMAPYGAWPASDGVVAGEPVLSDLTVEELERLLEEMEG